MLHCQSVSSIAAYYQAQRIVEGAVPYSCISYTVYKAYITDSYGIIQKVKVISNTYRHIQRHTILILKIVIFCHTKLFYNVVHFCVVYRIHVSQSVKNETIFLEDGKIIYCYSDIMLLISIIYNLLFFSVGHLTGTAFSIDIMSSDARAFAVTFMKWTWRSTFLQTWEYWNSWIIDHTRTRLLLSAMKCIDFAWLRQSLHSVDFTTRVNFYISVHNLWVGNVQSGDYDRWKDGYR